MSEYTKAENGTPETEGCTKPVTGFQRAGVCAPVTVTPFARTGQTVTKCCGEAVVLSGDKPCPGKKNGACSFTVSQTVCVEVPVFFGATATVGEAYVDCLGATSKDTCDRCEAGEM